MNSRERLLTTIQCQEPDHVPLLCWCFGFAPPPGLRFALHGRDVPHWYTMRMEHIHTLPEPWGIEYDFERVRRWLCLGLDDVLEVSPPWSMAPGVLVRDWEEPPAGGGAYPTLIREYETPAGVLRHAVHKTGEATPSGWVVQPEQVQLFEDFNIPRGVKHAVVRPEDLPKLRYLLCKAADGQVAAYRERMASVKRFAQQEGVLVQGWSAWGMDGVIWLTGVEEAVMAAMTEPEFFQELVDTMYAFDRQRTELLLDVGGVDMVVQRGWYSSIEFWSPMLFSRFVLPQLKDMAALVHQAGARFAYTMTMGVLPLADQLIEAGIDLLYYVDPVQDKADLSEVKHAVAGRMAMAGGINSGVTLSRGSTEEICQAVYTAVHTLGPGGGFVLAPVDALFPDTSWTSVKTMIEAWRTVRDYHG
jgi:hypothetical protein